MKLSDDEKQYLVAKVYLGAMGEESDVPLPIPTQHWLLNIQQPWAYLLVPPDLHLQVTVLGGGAYFLEAYEPEVGPQGPPKELMGGGDDSG